MVLCVIAACRSGRGRLTVSLLAVLALLLATGPWCSTHADHDRHAADAQVSAETVAERPTDESEPHCTAAGPVDTLARGHAGDTAPAMAAMPDDGLPPSLSPQTAVRRPLAQRARPVSIQFLGQLRI
jgi:hypothetical protein